MAMMACFALYRLDERAFVLLPGNLAVFVGLSGGALALGLQRRFWLPISLLGALLTAALGLFSLSQSGRPLPWMRLPGSPVIWLVVGLYCAFRLGLIYQARQRQQTAQRQDALRKKLAAEDDDGPAADHAAPERPDRPDRPDRAGQAGERSS